VDHQGQGQDLHSGYVWHTKEKRLLVEISEKMANNHKELIELIAEQLKHTKMTKAQVLDLRAKALAQQAE